jgi:Leucine-rich repeat (LRR) protein
LRESDSFARIELNMSGLEFKKINSSTDMLVGIKKLVLTHCSLKDFPVEIFLSNLENVDLSFNNIQEIKSELRFAPRIKELNLSCNIIRRLDSISGIFTYLKHLKSLNLELNDICKQLGYRQYLIKSIANLSSLDGITIEESEKVCCYFGLN